MNHYNVEMLMMDESTSSTINLPGKALLNYIKRGYTFTKIVNRDTNEEISQNDFVKRCNSEKIRNVKIEDIQSAYRGKVGCMCGCGDYAYASAKVVKAGADRGYSIDEEDDVSDLKVKRRFNSILKKLDTADSVFFEDNYFGIEFNGRTIVCYLSKKKVEEPKEPKVEEPVMKWNISLGCLGGEAFGARSAAEAQMYLNRRILDFALSSDPVTELSATNEKGESVTITLKEAQAACVHLDFQSLVSRFIKVSLVPGVSGFLKVEQELSVSQFESIFSKLGATRQEGCNWGFNEDFDHYMYSMEFTDADGEKLYFTYSSDTKYIDFN